MSIWYAIGTAVGVVFLAFALWFLVEAITAPLLDEQSRVISDPYRRMSRRNRSSWYRRRQRSAPARTGSVTGQTDGEPRVGLSKP